MCQLMRCLRRITVCVPVPVPRSKTCYSVDQPSACTNMSHPPMHIITYHRLFLDRSQKQLAVEQEETDMMPFVQVNTRRRSKLVAEHTLYPTDLIVSRHSDPLRPLRNCIGCTASGYANNMLLPCTHGIAGRCGTCSCIRRT